ncbi:MAG: hypothetical protein ACLRMZ_09955 [Blautia marasmi]
MEGSKYYFDENGYMKTGWLELDGEDYFLMTAENTTRQRSGPWLL